MNRATLSILIYHRVHAEVDPLFPLETTAEKFQREMRWIARWMRPLPLLDAVSRLEAGELPRRAVCVTFDDGYLDNLVVAAPILEQLRIPTTFFIASGFLDGGMMWNDRVIEAVRTTSAVALEAPWLESPIRLSTPDERCAAITKLLGALKHQSAADREAGVADIERRLRPRPTERLMMNREELCRLTRAGFSIGAHSVSHPILAKLDERSANDEIVESRATLESILQQPVESFAYPNGKPTQDYSAAHVGMVRAARFRCAVSTAVGAAGAGADVLQLPRFTPWDRDPARYLLRLMINARRVDFEVAG